MEIYKSESGKQVVLNRYAEILSQWPVQNKQYEVETSFGNTFVIESGSQDDPAVLLLHGSVSNSFTWFNDVTLLSESFNVYAIDIIGEAGFSAPNRPTYESGAYAQWLNETVDALGLSSCALIGMSLGGWMALEFATTYPKKVDQLILLCPGGLAREKASFLVKSIFFSLFGKWGQQQIFKMINGGTLQSPSGTSMANAFEFTGLIGKNFKPRTAPLRLFSEEALSNLHMPILLIIGEKDVLLPVDESVAQIKSAAPHAVVEILPDIGHVIVNQTSRIWSFLTAADRSLTPDL